MSTTPHSTPKKSPKRSVRSSRRLQGSSMPSWKVLLAESDGKKSKKNSKEEESPLPEPDVESEIIDDSDDGVEDEVEEKGTLEVEEEDEEGEEEEEEEKEEEVAQEEEDDDDAPEAVSLSAGKQMALDLKKKESESQKAYKVEQKERARKLFRSDNVRSDNARDKEEISFLDPSVLEAIEEDESKKETEEQKKKEEREEKRKRKREAREARERASQPKRKKFSNVDVVLSSDVGGRSVNPRARSRLNRHFNRIDRSSTLSSHSASRTPSSSFV